MAGINIPGVTDRYNTNDTIEKLMKVERIPLTREENQLKSLQSEKDAWREVNTQLSSLRDSTKQLYSFENPFNNKITSSSDENAITAEATRSADFQSFKVDVIQPATADRFLTAELDSDANVKAGMYIFKVGEKQLTLNWKGGSLKNFSEAINKRSNGVIKSMIIGASQGKKSLLIESLQTGKDNKLIFEEAAKEFAENSGMISLVKTNSTVFGKKASEFSKAEDNNSENIKGMPQLTIKNVEKNGETTVINPRGSLEIKIPLEAKKDQESLISFTIKASQTEDITTALNEVPVSPQLPDTGEIEFGGIHISNSGLETTLKKVENHEPLSPILNSDAVFLKMADGSEKRIDTEYLLTGQEIKINEPVKNVQSIIIRNRNTGHSYEVSEITSSNPKLSSGYIPNHPVSTADDAIIKYEGITITRPTNTIDDVIPEITLNVHAKTDKTASITVKPDTEASKEALITFVGKYNQAVAQINILSQAKPELIDELDYLTDDEKEKKREQLGLFQTDFSLTSIKSNMSTIIAAGYKSSEDAEITMLSQIGISTNAAGFSGSYTQSKLRGYLEIDEKKLDSALENHLDDIKKIFGYDSDGDLIVDTGIAYNLDKQLSAYTQTGGILAMKTSSLDSKIKSSEQKIAKLESQMEDKEAQLRQQYGTMEGTLNSLESQQNAITNFSKQNSNRN